MSGWHTRAAPAKLNLALVVGPLRPDGKHEVVTVMERLSLADTVSVRRSSANRVSGFVDDTLVEAALDGLTERTDGRARFEARIQKRIPVAAGLGGGSSDAAAALVLASGLLDEPLDHAALDGIAASLGADVPFFLRDGAQLATGDGTTLTPLDLRRDYAVLLVLPTGARKDSTRDVYAAFDERCGAAGYEDRRTALLDTLAGARHLPDLARLPPNDLVTTPLAADLRAAGAFRADVTGAGPVVYGLFRTEAEAAAAARVFAAHGATWVVKPG